MMERDKAMMEKADREQTQLEKAKMDNDMKEMEEILRTRVLSSIKFDSKYPPSI
jgi:hypothetical protein